MVYKINIYGSSTSVSDKMQWKCLLFPLCLAVVVRSASISNNDIPVKVVYDNKYPHRNYIRNLNEKVQLSAEQLRQLELQKITSEEVDKERGNNFIKNLEEKVQLSAEQLEQERTELQIKSKYVNAIKNHDEKIQLSPDEQSEALKYFPLLDNNNDDYKISFRTVILESDDKSFHEKIEEVVNKGIQDLKNKAKKSEMTKHISPDVWKKLDSDVKEFLEKIKTKDSLRQSNQNILQQFQQFTNGFLSQFTVASTANDDQQPGFPQNIINFFTNGLQQIQSGLSNLAGQNQPPAQSDPDTTTKAPNSNPIQSIVSSVQGVFSQFNPFNPGQAQSPSTQGEEPNQPNGPLQSIQNAINQFGETINSFNPFNPQTQKPDTAGDETSTTAAGPLQFVQGIASQAGQVFNQLNPFQQSTTKGPEADPTKNPLQAAVENVGSQITDGVNNIVGSNNPISGAAQQIGEALQGGSNPLQVAQGVAEQVGEAISSSNPLQSGSNPLETAQGAAQQVGEAIVNNNPLQGANNPLQAAQGVVQQVGEAIGNNPLQNILPASTSKQPEKE